MYSITNFTLKYSVLVNMLTIGILIFGLISMVTMPREEFPAVEFGFVFVVVPYPGVSPAEIEQLIINKVENELGDLENLDNMSSTAEEGRGTIRLVFDSGIEPVKAYDNVIRELSKINDLPSDALDPIVIRASMREVNPIAQIVVGGEFSPGALGELAEEVQDGILDIENISKVEIVGQRERQMWVDADQAKLDAYGLSLGDLTGLLQGRNLNIPGGTTRYGKVEFLVRTLGQFQNVEEIASMIVMSDPTGRAIRISDVAAVRDTLEKPQTIARINGEKSISLFLYKKGDGNIIKVMQDVRDYVQRFEKSVPGLQISVRNDGSIDVRNGINALGSNALFGIILVFIALLIFLGWRNALMASIGIPLSILITFVVVPLFGITLNNLTIFGLIIVVGMVVDNSIVALENIHRFREQGFCHRDSIVMGVNQVIAPVFSSTLTTVAAFMPMLLMEGIMGQFLSVFPIVVSVALLGSWFQSMVILPNNVYQFGKGLPTGENRSTRLIKPLINRYQKILTAVLKRRALLLWSTIGLLVVALGILASGLIQFEFFPTAPSQTISLRLETPIGSTLEETEAVTLKVEDFISQMKEKEDIRFVVSNVGATGGEMGRMINTSTSQVNIDLVDIKEMKYTQDEIRASLRKFLDSLPGLYAYRFTRSGGGPPIGNDVELRIKGEDIERLTYLSEMVKNSLREIPGVVDIEDSFDTGKKEVKIVPKQDLVSMAGLSVAQIAGTVRTASTGSEVSQFRGEGTKEFPIIVKLDDYYTQDLEMLKNLKIRTRTGDLIAIRDLADFEITSSLSKIEHRDKKRVVTITASVAEYDEGGRMRKRTSQEVVNILLGNRLRNEEGMLGNFEQRYPGYSIEFGGVQEEQRKSYGSLVWAFGLAILLIFTVLATQFRSYVQPLIVMFTIPFAFIGVIFGLLVTGLSFSLNTMISVVALAGVVVNNAIIMIDFINNEREKGVDRWHAIVNSGSARLRPIILTTATTVAGMLPLVFSGDPSAQVWRPLAVSFTFGLLFATLLTLFVIPVIYSLIDSFFGRFHMTRFTEHLKYQDAMECKKES